MLNSLLQTDLRMLPIGSLLAAAFTGSVWVWWHLLQRIRRGLPLLETDPRPRAEWTSALSLVTVYLAISVIMSSVLGRWLVVPTTPQALPDLQAVAMSAAISLGMTTALLLTSATGAGSWSAIGLSMSNLWPQVRTGIQGYFAAVIPTAVALAALASLRDAESQHSLLKLLMQSDDLLTVGVIAFAAAIVAPLFEELIYRVILQGWLCRLFSPSRVIPVVAVLFALIHGWRDGLALIPLALILGYVFQRSHSYLSVVVIHAAFNATMLTLQLLSNRLQAGD